MSEKTLQDNIRKMMTGVWDCHKHNDIMPGVPDLSFSMPGLDGWMELKWAAVPARVDTVVRFKKGQGRSWAAQKVWMRKRIAKGGACFVVAQVGGTVLLFWGETACWELDVATLAQLQETAWAWWIGTPEAERFVWALARCAAHYRRAL